MVIDRLDALKLRLMLIVYCISCGLGSVRRSCLAKYRLWLFLVSLLVLCFSSFTPFLAHGGRYVPGNAESATSRHGEIVGNSLWMLHAHRRRYGLGVLQSDTRLFASARKFASYLLESGTFSHTADGLSPHERITAEGIASCMTAENLAYFETSSVRSSSSIAFSLFEMLRNSPGHNRNMLSREATHVGIGVAEQSGRGKFILVQHFSGACS